MPEINPYEAPQEESRPTKKPERGNSTSSSLQLAFAVQLIAIIVALFSCTLSMLATWGTDIQKYSWYATISAGLATTIAVGMIIYAYRNGVSWWVRFECWILGFLALFFLARS